MTKFDVTRELLAGVLKSTEGMLAGREPMSLTELRLTNNLAVLVRIVDQVLTMVEDANENSTP